MGNPVLWTFWYVGQCQYVSVALALALFWFQDGTCMNIYCLAHNPLTTKSWESRCHSGLWFCHELPHLIFGENVLLLSTTPIHHQSLSVHVSVKLVDYFLIPELVNLPFYWSPRCHTPLRSTRSECFWLSSDPGVMCHCARCHWSCQPSAVSLNYKTLCYECLHYCDPD